MVQRRSAGNFTSVILRIEGSLSEYRPRASLTANHRAAEAFLISAGQLVTSIKPDWFYTVTRTAKRLPSGAMSYGGEP